MNHQRMIELKRSLQERVLAESLDLETIQAEHAEFIALRAESENLIRTYLLGELTEADQAALEQELLMDRGKFDQVRAVENELIDSYVRGEMSRADRERFEGHYLASPLHRERVEIAASFLADIDQAVGETGEG